MCFSECLLVGLLLAERLSCTGRNKLPAMSLAALRRMTVCVICCVVDLLFCVIVCFMVLWFVCALVCLFEFLFVCAFVCLSDCLLV